MQTFPKAEFAAVDFGQAKMMLPKFMRSRSRELNQPALYGANCSRTFPPFLSWPAYRSPWHVVVAQQIFHGTARVEVTS